MKPEKLNKDYQEFIKSDGIMPNLELDQKIIGLVTNELNPSHHKVFLKLLTVQAFIGFLTLLFCPQFQLSLTNNHDLFHYFHHRFGENICMMICGSIFLGTGTLFASYLLNRAEILKIRKSTFLYHMTMSIIFLSTFLILGTSNYLILNMFWFLGAAISALVLFEINSRFRIKVLTY